MIGEKRKPIRAIGDWQTNADLIAEVAELGLFEIADGVEGSVLDATYGLHGGFWKRYRPQRLTTNDIAAPADHAWDFRRMPVGDGAFDVVVFDPDYKLSGTPALGAQDRRYGTHVKKSRDERLDDIVVGAVECYRVCRVRVMVKCQDQVVGGQMVWQTDDVTKALLEAGARKRDRFDFGAFREPRKQPEFRPCGRCKGIDSAACAKCTGAGQVEVRQQHALHAGISQLLVFEKPPRLRGRRSDPDEQPLPIALS